MQIIIFREYGNIFTNVSRQKKHLLCLICHQRWTPDPVLWNCFFFFHSVCSHTWFEEVQNKWLYLGSESLMSHWQDRHYCHMHTHTMWKDLPITVTESKCFSSFSHSLLGCIVSLFGRDDEITVPCTSSSKEWLFLIPATDTSSTYSPASWYDSGPKRGSLSSFPLSWKRNDCFWDAV